MRITQKNGQPWRIRFGVDTFFLIVVVLYLLVPLGATLAFGLSGAAGFSFATFRQIFSDPDFSQTLLLSLALSCASTILAVVLVTPTVYWVQLRLPQARDRKSTRLNSSHSQISYAVFCLK